MKPILKKPTANPGILGNFHPISLLPALGKLLEATINKQLSNYLEANDFLDPSQSGFRPGFSTETALLAVTDSKR